VISEHAEHIACSVLDTGRRPPEMRPGRGQRLVQALAAELGGFIEWRFVPAGCRARLQFPTTRAADALAAAWMPCAGRRLAEAG
jgi:two-component sensor histidine kinase